MQRHPEFSEDLDLVVRNSLSTHGALDKSLPWENVVDALTEVLPGATGFRVRVQQADAGIRRSIISGQTPYERGLHRLHLECVRVGAPTTAESEIEAPRGRFPFVVETPKEILADKLQAHRGRITKVFQGARRVRHCLFATSKSLH